MPSPQNEDVAPKETFDLGLLLISVPFIVPQSALITAFSRALPLNLPQGRNVATSLAVPVLVVLTLAGTGPQPPAVRTLDESSMTIASRENSVSPPNTSLLMRNRPSAQAPAALAPPKQTGDVSTAAKAIPSSVFS